MDMPGLFRKRSRAEVGKAAEQAANNFLEAHGCITIERNYHCRMGEIDLVMRHGETLVFVEVRYRQRSEYGSGAESVGPRKQGRLIRTAQHYLQTRGLTDRCPVRFDVVALRPNPGDGFAIDWIPNAFETL